MAEVVVALLTPFGPDGRLDRGALREHVELLVDGGVDGLMPCGTTGEGLLLDDDELQLVIAETLAAVAGRVRVLAHVGRASTAATVRAAQAAVGAGVDGVSAVVPFYYSYDDAQIVRHFRTVVEALDGTAVYAYAIPARTGNELTPAAARELGEHGLRGVKDSTKSRERMHEYLGCGVDVLTGTDAFVHEAFAAGAAGCVSAIANVRPDLLCALRDGGGEDVQAELLEVRARTPFPRLKEAVAERLASYPVAYRAPLG